MPDWLTREGFSFADPVRLWALVGVALLAVAVGVEAVRRRSAARRWADSALLPAVAPRRPGWRRAPGQLLLLLALVLGTAAWAGPEEVAEQAQERSVVVLALDVSGSMAVTDVVPNRLEAARTAALEFLDDLPDEVDAALVTYAGTSTLTVPPTSDRAAVVAGLDGLELQGGTDVGGAVLLSLDAVQRGLPPQREGQAPAARIVLITDGGLPPAGADYSVAVQRAVEVGVPVSTVTIGTPEGQYPDGRPEPVRLEEMAQIAAETGGTAYTAEDLDTLDGVYADIGSQLERETARVPLGHWAAGGALALLLAAAVPSVLLLGRLP